MGTTTENAAAPLEVAPTEQLIVGLDRLLRLSSVYAAEHPVVARMTLPVLANLQQLAAESGSVRLRLDADAGLEVGTATIPASHPAVARLHDLFEWAGVEGLELAATTAAPDLCELGRWLRTRPAPLQAAESGDAPTLPPSIRLIESRFGHSRAPRARGETRRLLEEILHAAFASAPASTEPSPPSGIVRKTLLLVLARLEEDSASGEVAPEVRTAIVRLLSKLTRSALDSRGVLSQGTLTVGRLLLEMREVLQRASGEEVARVVVDRALASAELHLLPLAEGRAGSALVDPTASFPVEPDLLAMTDVVHRLEKLARTEPALAPEQFDCGEEHLSIFVHLRSDAAVVGADQPIEPQLVRALAATDDAQRRAVIGGFVDGACRLPDPTRADRLLAIVARTLRQEEPAKFAELLAGAAEALHPDARTWIWPHVASELLLGLPTWAAAIEERLVALLLDVPAATFAAGGARLLRMPCARGNLLHGARRRVLWPPRLELYALYAIALSLPEVSGIGELVFEAFRTHPPTVPAARALVALPQLDGRARTLLRLLLEQRSGDRARRQELDETAVRLLVDALERQPRQQRDEPWVAEAVRALAQLPGAESERMVRRVIRERRWLLVPTWPGRCRRLARSRR